MEFYQPHLTTGDVYFQHPLTRPQLAYNHDADLIRFKGRYYAAWNANQEAAEGVGGQFNYLTSSDDLERWAPPVKIFTSEGGATNPVDADNQWQPAFINYRDQRLFCAWSIYWGGRTFISHTDDGRHWTNVEVPAAPPALAGKFVAYPSTRGLVSSAGHLMFPCSLPPTGEKNIPDGKTIYAGVLISEDGGKSWTWSEPIEAQSWAGHPRGKDGDTSIYFWEPTIFEAPGRQFGMTMRNVSRRETHRMLLATKSADGRRWAKASPVEVDAVCTRSMVLSRASSAEDLQLVTNDWRVGILPDNPRISKERYQLALFCAPVCDPDLLLPGPLVQPEGGRAYYPSGFASEGRLHLIYTYVENPGQNNCIHHGTLDALPDYSRPFLLPRGGRSGLAIKGRVASLQQRYTSLGLVLTAALTRQPTLTFSFRLIMERYDGTPFPVLTLGGSTRDGIVIRATCPPGAHEDRFVIDSTEKQQVDLGHFQLKQWSAFKIILSENDWSVSLDGGRPVTSPHRLLRKISFGGLYENPEWPMGMFGASDVQIDLDSITLA